jgi:hypothetical protein
MIVVVRSIIPMYNGENLSPSNKKFANAAFGT